MSAILQTMTQNAHSRVAEQFPGLVPTYNDDFPGRNITLFGSFKPANWERIRKVRDTFRQLGFCVLAPQGEDFTGFCGDFEILDADVTKIDHMEEALGRPLSPAEQAHSLEVLFQKAMDISDICYLVADERDGVDDGGYMGISAAVELGRLWRSRPVIASRRISPSLDERDGYGSLFAGCVEGLYVASPEEVAAIMDAGGSFVGSYGVTTVHGANV